MDSLKGYLLLVTLLAVKAWEDPDKGQRGVGLPDDHDMLQRMVGLPDDIVDMMRQGSLVPQPTVRQKGPHINHHSMNPSIPFPLARPTMENIVAICHYSNRRPRYTEDMLPRSGFGYLHRQAGAVNQLESWFTVCCSNGTQDEELTLCCAQEAYEKSLSNFCEEEFTIKTNHYHCCRKYGKERWDCFENEAPDPSYQPSGAEVPTVLPYTVQGFEFNSSSCQKTSVSETKPMQEMMIEPPTPSFPEQRMAIPQIPMLLGQKDISDTYVFSPRSMKPSITFPLARPTTTNIHAICQYKRILPRNGPHHLRHKASAVNQLVSWYSVCCANGSEDDKLTLCCAQQAWVKSLIAFCEGELHFKSTHHCCRENGQAKLDCFEKKASGASYQPSGHGVLPMLPSTIQGFDFDPSRCQITSDSISEVASTDVTVRINAADIGFPPGRPNSVNIGQICAFHKRGPGNLNNCLIHPGFDQLAHQLKAIDDLGKSFSRCCKGKQGVQACAERKWEKVVDKFCKHEKVQVNQYECCKKRRRQERYDCFSTASPDQNYSSMNYHVRSDAPPNLNMFCDTYTDLQKMNRLPFTVDEMAEKCCTLVADERSACLELQLDNLPDDACQADNPLLAQGNHKCCKKTTKGRSKCFTSLLLHYIGKAKRDDNGKKCPVIV